MKMGMSSASNLDIMTTSMSLSNHRLQQEAEKAMKPHQPHTKSYKFAFEAANPLRRRLLDLVESKYCDAVVAAVILLNVGLMVIEADFNANCDDACSDSTIEGLNLAFTLFYTIEAGLKMLAFMRHFFKDMWNMIDLAVVCLGWFERLMTGVDAPLNLLRLVRVTRLFRASRVLKLFPELHMMVAGFVQAMMAVFWGSFMIMVILMIWSLIAVEMIHPEFKKLHNLEPECMDAYGSVWQATMTFFQTIVAGDSWGRCTMPLIEQNWAWFIPFGLAFVHVQLGTMNLILSVIVDSATKAREQDKEESVRQEILMREKMTEQLLELLKSVDTDGSGTLSYDEFQEGYHENDDLKHLVESLKLKQDDLRVIFDVMDVDRSGLVSYHSFIDFLQNTSQEQLQQYIMMARLMKTREEAMQGWLQALILPTSLPATPQKLNLLQVPQDDKAAVIRTSSGREARTWGVRSTGVSNPESASASLKSTVSSAIAGFTSPFGGGGTPTDEPSANRGVGSSSLHKGHEHEFAKTLQDSAGNHQMSMADAATASQPAAAAHHHRDVAVQQDYVKHVATCHHQFSRMLQRTVCDFERLLGNLQGVELRSGVSPTHPIEAAAAGSCAEAVGSAAAELRIHPDDAPVVDEAEVLTQPATAWQTNPAWAKESSADGLAERVGSSSRWIPTRWFQSLEPHSRSRGAAVSSSICCAGLPSGTLGSPDPMELDAQVVPQEAHHRSAPPTSRRYPPHAFVSVKGGGVATEWSRAADMDASRGRFESQSVDERAPGPSDAPAEGQQRLQELTFV
mmetsp:Transcript_43740/g.103316  ORF Transcript_43740/g.103316 Transcript_43740/m.103316 type:complete len:793 (+) Transcript_43740:97-2475(+)